MEDNSTSPDASPVAVVGAGAVGTALARRLDACGYAVRAILSRTAASAQALAERVGASVGTDDPAALPAEVRLVLICVPDDAIAAVADTLAAVDHPWARTLVGHTSGAQTADALAALGEQGAAPFSFHPLQTFPAEAPPDLFEDITIGIEGDPDAVAVGAGLARRLGGHPLQLSAQEKARYHCAAALASNGLAALMSAVHEVLAGVRPEGDEAAAPTDMMAPLVEQTWAHLKDAPPERALTGPIARGDHETIAAHLDALADQTPHLMPLYAALSTEMARAAIRGGQLSADAAEDLLRLLRRRLPSSEDDSDPRNPSR